MQNRLLRYSAIVIGTIAIGGAIAYAVFTSNTVTIGNNLLTTGEAMLKLCDSQGNNNWVQSINPTLNGIGLSSEREQDLLGDRAVYLGNDNGQLLGPDGHCQSYGDTASQSAVSMKVMPNVSYAAETCPDTLPSQIRLRFEINGTNTDYKTLTSWASNATSFEPTLEVGQTAKVKVFAQLGSTASSQRASCQLSIHFTGKQPS